MNSQNLFADIIVDITNENLDKTFQYIVPDSMRDILKPGMLVRVPFGNGSRKIRGYVIQVTEYPAIEVERMKMIEAIEEQGNSIESRLISLAAWIREQYGSTMIQALKTVLPVKEKMKQKFYNELI